MKIELCIEDIAAMELAIKHSANRVELCASLSEGGLTPSHGMIETACQQDKVEVHVLIRPRGGDFIYSDSEMEVIKNDIKIAALLGAKGAVVGFLNLNHGIDQKKCREVFDLCSDLGLEMTFHRAFDFTHDPKRSLDQLIEIGVQRILSSGQAQKAIDGLDLLNELHERSAGRIEIMAGSGVNDENALHFKELDAIHFSVHHKGGGNVFGMGIRNVLNENKLIRIKEKLGMK